MTKSNVGFNNASSGELSPKLYGRSDLQLYFNGAQRIENFVPQTQGGLRFRTGTKYQDTTNTNKPARLKLYEFKDEEAYILEFSNTEIRVYTASGRDAGAVITGASPYLEAELDQLMFAQDADTLYITHKNHQPRTFIRTAASAFTIALFAPSGNPFTGVNLYPAAVTIYESRLIFGGSNTSPQKLWFSEAGNFNQFTLAAAVATDPLQYTIGKGDPVPIVWLRATDKALAIGTTSDVFRAVGAGEDAISQTNPPIITPTNAFGCASIEPVNKGSSIVYADRSGLNVYSFEWDELSQGFIPVDRNLLSDHITVSGIKQMGFASGRPDIVYAVLNDGKMIGMTFNPQENVQAWHRYPTNGEVVSVESLPRDGLQEQLWICVKRGTEYFVESFDDYQTFTDRREVFTGAGNEEADNMAFGLLHFEEQKQVFFVDAGVTFDGRDRGNTAGASVTPAAVTGSSVTFTASASLFLAGDVGKQIWAKGERGRAIITTFNSGTDVTCNIIDDFDDANAIAAGDYYITDTDISGLTHLNGFEVVIVADGGFDNEGTTVSGGTVSAKAQSSVIHAGLKYSGYFETMDIEGGGLGGAAQNKLRSISHIGIRFWNTLGAEYGTNLYKMERVLFRESDGYTDRPPELFNGDQKLKYSDKTSRNKTAIIKQDVPLPCNIQLVMVYMNTSN